MGRREAIAGLGAVFAALSAPSDVAAELTPFAETTLRWLPSLIPMQIVSIAVNIGSTTAQALTKTVPAFLTLLLHERRQRCRRLA